MPEYYGFLESIAGRSALHPDEGPPESLYEAVRNHLFLLLNTRQGSHAFLEDYGLPDLTAVYKGYPESLQLLAATLTKLISRYEPRLRNVRVELKSSSEVQFEASFTITGYLENENGSRDDVVFETTIGHNGKVSIGR